MNTITPKLQELLNHPEFSIARAIMDQDLSLEIGYTRENFPTILDGKIKRFLYLLEFTNELSQIQDNDSDPYIGIILESGETDESAYGEHTFIYNEAEQTISIIKLGEGMDAEYEQEYPISQIKSICLGYDT